MDQAPFPGLLRPRCVPPLDDAFVPAALFNRAFRSENSPQKIPLVIGLSRGEDGFSRIETQVFAEGQAAATMNLEYVERLVKFLLWQRGGYKLYVGGPR